MKRQWRFTFFQKMLVVSLIFLVVAQFFLPPYYRFFLTQVFIFGIFALGYDILLGYTGLLSFGHALFFAMGSYAFINAVRLLHLNLWLSILTAIIFVAIFSAAVGFLAIRIRGVYFVIITFIFSMVFYYIAMTDPYGLTGADDGITITSPPIDLGFIKFSGVDPTANYYLALTMLIASYIVCRRIVQSPFGQIIKALKENELRTKCLGYNTSRAKLLAFTISGTFSGLSGALFAHLHAFANAFYFGLHISADVVIWTLCGGAGTLIGPIIGTAVVTFFLDWIKTHTGLYLLFLGILLIFIVTIAPRGIMGFVTARLPRIGRYED